MKIIHVVYACTPGAHRGGVSKMVHELAAAQLVVGHDVQIYSLSPQEEPVINQPVPIVYFKRHALLGSAFSDELSASVSRLPLGTVIHLHNTFHYLNIQVSKAARVRGLPVFHHPHGALDPHLLDGWSFLRVKKRIYAKIIEAPLLNCANGVFALTTNEAHGLRKLGVKSPIHVVPNGIMLSPPAIPSGRFNAINRLRILYIGRINPKKRIEEILHAISLVGNQGLACHLLIAGDANQFPSYSASLRELSTRLCLDDKVEWLGFRDEMQKRELFGQSDLFIHSSESEGMAMAILEAMANRLPVIASSGCYMSTAAEKGALIEYGSGSLALAHSLVKFAKMSAPEREQLALVGRMHVESSHSWETLARQIVDVYAKN